MRRDSVRTHRGEHLRESRHDSVDLNDHQTRGREQGQRARPRIGRNDGERAGRSDRKIRFRNPQLRIGDSRAHRSALDIRYRHRADYGVIGALERLANRAHISGETLPNSYGLCAELVRETYYSTGHRGRTEYSKKIAAHAFELAREWLQDCGRKRSQHSNGSRMPRHPGKPAGARSRPLDRPWPLQRMLADAFFPAQMKQDTRDINFDRTDILARAAQRRGKRQVSSRAAKKIRADDRAARARIHRTICMPARSPGDRAYVEARTASNAVQRFAQDRIREHRAAPVVENHHVHLAGPVELALAPRSGDKTGVGRQLLAGLSSRKYFKEGTDIFEI